MTLGPQTRLSPTLDHLASRPRGFVTSAAKLSPAIPSLQSLHAVASASLPGTCGADTVS